MTGTATKIDTVLLCYWNGNCRWDSNGMCFGNGGSAIEINIASNGVIKMSKNTVTTSDCCSKRSVAVRRC